MRKSFKSVGQHALAVAGCLAVSMGALGQAEMPGEGVSNTWESPGLCAAGPLKVDFDRGPMADYGASPWFTTDLQVGISPSRFIFDTGTTNLWTTTDLCDTPACLKHWRIDTAQPGLKWIENPPGGIEENFGPWGKMYVWIGRADFFLASQATILNLVFGGAIKFTGNQFGDLAWDGGIGFPSESSDVTNLSFFFGDLVEATGLAPTFSMYGKDANGKGATILGGTNPEMYDASSVVVLPPQKGKAPGVGYLWGTNLNSVHFGGRLVPELSNQTFFVDSGSSRFKGDAAYLYPLMNVLVDLKDASGQPIFDKVYETVSGQSIWTSLVYRNGKGPADYAGRLPDLSLELGSACRGDTTRQLSLALTPDQYSYKVDIGDRAGEWVVAMHRLDGVGGLLVGSTVMDLVYTNFNYTTHADGSYSQGNMYFYEKTQGAQPNGYDCVPRVGFDLETEPY